jgi:hypothetical protein
MAEQKYEVKLDEEEQKEVDGRVDGQVDGNTSRSSQRKEEQNRALLYYQERKYQEVINKFTKSSGFQCPEYNYVRVGKVCKNIDKMSVEDLVRHCLSHGMWAAHSMRIGDLRNIAMRGNGFEDDPSIEVAITKKQPNADDTEIRVTWPHPFKLNVLTDNGYQIPLPSFDWLLSQMKARNKRKGVHLNVNGWRNHPEHVKKMMEVLYTYERACYDAMKAVRTHTQKKFHIEEQKILFNISRFSTDTNIKEANSYKDLVQKQVYNLITRILAIQDKEAKERLPVYVATSEKKNTNLYKIKKQGDNEEKSGSRRLYLTTSIPLSDNMQILIPDSDDIGYYFIKRGDEIKSVSKNLFDSMPYDMKSIRLLVRSNRRLMQRVAREETSYEDFLAQS